jgi:competence protein ComEC
MPAFVLSATALIFALGYGLPFWLCLLVCVIWLYFKPAQGALLLALVLISQWQVQQQLSTRWPEDLHGENLTQHGHVASFVQQESDGTLRFSLQTEGRTFKAAWYRPPDAFKNGGLNGLKGGQCLHFTAKFKSPTGTYNFSGFDFEGWLLGKGFDGLANLKQASFSDDCPATLTTSWLAFRQRWAEKLPPLAAALTLGDGSRFSDDDWQAFRNTGTAHLVVVSGGNLALVAGAVFFAVNALWRRTRWALFLPAQRAGQIAALIIGWLYTALAGFDAPIVRAAWMLSMVVLFWAKPWPALAAAWVLILAFDPFTWLSAGLWLSFAATAALLLFVKRPDWSAFLQLQGWTTVALLPLSIYFFQGISLLSLPMNLLAVPLFALLTPVAFALALLALCGLDVGFSYPLWDTLMHGLHALNLPLHAISAPAVPLGLSGAGLVLIWLNAPIKPLALALQTPLLLALVWPLNTSPKQGLNMEVLDVGQGLSVLIQTPKHTLLYDAGPRYPGGLDTGERIVVPRLRALGVRKLDALVLSHDDRDHTGGSEAVLAAFPTVQRWGVGGQACQDGQSWRWDGVIFRFLHPNPSQPLKNDNDQSCVLWLQWQESDQTKHALLTGDISQQAESQLLQRYPQLPVDVLIAPHHGSKNSSSAAFIAATQAKTVIFSAGWRNHFNHPHPDVLARYAAFDSRLISTGDSGALRYEHRRWQAARAQAWLPPWVRGWQELVQEPAHD